MNPVFRHAYTIVLCVSAAFNSADAENDTPAASDSSLDEVVVVANRAPEPLSKVGNSVTVLTDAAIQASQSPMVADLLVQTPGLTVARAGGMGQPTSVFIRGAESDQTVVVIDGVQLNDPSTTAGGFDFENLLTGDVTRIEILRGAQSTLYGSQAMGGVINVTTADPSAASGGALTAEGGSHNTGYTSGNMGGKSDSLMWRLSGDWYGTSGIPAFDERLGGTRPCASQIGGGSGQLRYDLTPDLEADVRGYYVQARTDFDGFDTPSDNFGNDNEYGKTDQLLGYAGLTLRSPDRRLSNRIAYHYTYTDTRDYDPDAPANYGSPSSETFYGVGQNEREEYQGIWRMTPRYQLVYGAQHERSTIDTDTPAYDYTGPAPTRNYASIDSGYAQLQGEVISGLTLTGGERYDRHDVFGGHTTGAFAAAWALDDARTIVRSSFSQGFKAPSLYELYSNYGNPALRPEAGESWDAGIEQHAWERRLMLSAAYFQRYSRDLIEFFDCTTPVGCLHPTALGYYANLSRAAAHGVELQGTLDPSERITLAANYTLTETEDQSPGSPTYGQELIRRPKNAANASVTYRWPFPLTANIAVRYAGPSFDDGPYGGRVKLGGYVLGDVRMSYAIHDRLEVYARVENVTGKHYETIYEYGTLGRVAYAGVRTTF